MKKRILTLILSLLLTAMLPVLPAQANERFTITPSGMMTAKNGTIVIADRAHHVLRMRSMDGSYTILAGKVGVSGSKNALSTRARFNEPWDVASYNGGYIISDSANQLLRFYKDGNVSTIKGTGKNKSLSRPTGLATGENGEVYIADTDANVIKKIDKNGRITIFAGGKKGCKNGKNKSARFNEPTGLYYYKGALFVADSGNHRICKIENGRVTTIAGTAKGREGDATGRANRACLSNPQDIFVNADGVYISDTGNACIKKLANGKLTTVVSAFSLGDGRSPAEPGALVVRNDKLFFGDTFTEELYRYKLSK